MIVQITLTRNELFLIKEMLPLWQRYADAFVFMVDRSDDGTVEFLNENKEKYNILSVLTTDVTDAAPPIESEIRQRLFDEALKYSGNIICLDTDEYLDGTLTKDQLEIILNANPDTLVHSQWIQYTGKNEVRIDGPWGFNFKDRIGSYRKPTKFKTAQMHSEHLPVPEKQGSIEIPKLFIAHLQWLDKRAVAIKQYYWKIVDYVNRTQFGVDTVPASAYDASVNDFNWKYKSFDFPLKVRYDVYQNQPLETNYKYNFIKKSVKQFNIPNLNDWGMGIH